MAQLLHYYKSFQRARAPTPTPSPTFEDLAIDINLTEIQRLAKYANSSIGLQRLVHVKMVSYIATTVGFDETESSILPLLRGFASDPETAIRQHFVEQLATLAEFCFSVYQVDNNPGAYDIVLQQLLPLTAQLLDDEKMEVRKSASVTLVRIAKLMKTEDLGAYILTIVLRLSHEDGKEEIRMIAAELLNSLAEIFGQDLCKQFVIPEFVSLAEDPAARVRKAAALSLHNVCRIGGEYELFERLMPAFVRLSKDDMYFVRKACAESLPEVSKCASDEIRAGVLIEIYLRLAQDPSRTVKETVLLGTGYFIATLPRRIVNETMMTHYRSLSACPIGDADMDAGLMRACAFCMPAVLVTLGVSKWPDIRPIYIALVQSGNAEVRKTLAHSLHEIAKVLITSSQDLVVEELVPLFEEFIQDAEPVQIGIMKHISEFLKTLPETNCVSYVSLLLDIMHSTNPFNWRLRQSLALQLPAIISLPPRASTYSLLFPLVMALLQDPVACVRTSCFPSVVALLVLLESNLRDNIVPAPYISPDDDDIEVLVNDTDELGSAVESINSLIHSRICQHRQVWAELCCTLVDLLPCQLMEQHFIDGILVLTTDPVCNVRIAVSQIFARVAGRISKTVAAESPSQSYSGDLAWFIARPDIQECVRRLARDDHDVYLNMTKLQHLFSDVSFSSLDCRGLKQSPAGDEPIINSDASKSSTTKSQSVSTMSPSIHEKTNTPRRPQSLKLLDIDLKLSLRAEIDGQHFVSPARSPAHVNIASSGGKLAPSPHPSPSEIAEFMLASSTEEMIHGSMVRASMLTVEGAVGEFSYHGEAMRLDGEDEMLDARMPTMPPLPPYGDLDFVDMDDMESSLPQRGPILNDMAILSDIADVGFVMSGRPSPNSSQPLDLSSSSSSAMAAAPPTYHATPVDISDFSPPASRSPLIPSCETSPGSSNIAQPPLPLS